MFVRCTIYEIWISSFCHFGVNQQFCYVVTDELFQNSNERLRNSTFCRHIEKDSYRVRLLNSSWEHFLGKLSQRRLRIFLGKYLRYELIWAEHGQFERVLFFGEYLPFKLTWAELYQLEQILRKSSFNKSVLNSTFPRALVNFFREQTSVETAHGRITGTPFYITCLWYLMFKWVPPRRIWRVHSMLIWLLHLQGKSKRIIR